MEQKYNLRSPAVKRLMREAQELHQPTEEFFAHPLEDNLFEWHFTVRGQPESDFDGGLYHGRIILPPEYPMKPPSIILLTPNGRFEVNKKICLSISGHHPESWQPCWSIRTVLLAIIGFMPTPGKGAIGSLDYTPKERQMLAKKSQNWQCNVCGTIKDCLMKQSDNFSAVNQEAKELAAQISFKSEVDSSVSEASVKNGMTVKESATASLFQALSPPVKNAENKVSENPVSNYVLAETSTCSELLPPNQYPEVSSDNSSPVDITSSQVCDLKDVNSQSESMPAENSIRQRHHNSAVENIVHNERNIESSTSHQRNSSTVMIFVIVLVIIGLLFRRIFLSLSHYFF